MATHPRHVLHGRLVVPCCTCCPGELDSCLQVLQITELTMLVLELLSNHKCSQSLPCLTMPRVPCGLCVWRRRGGPSGPSAPSAPISRAVAPAGNHEQLSRRIRQSRPWLCSYTGRTSTNLNFRNRFSLASVAFTEPGDATPVAALGLLSLGPGPSWRVLLDDPGVPMSARHALCCESAPRRFTSGHANDASDVPLAGVAGTLVGVAATGLLACAGRAGAVKSTSTKLGSVP